MEIPAGMILTGVPLENQCKLYVLCHNKSLYGLKQALANWYEMLKKGLMDRGFTPSQVDLCVFICNDAIVLVYVNDCIIISPKYCIVSQFIK